MRAQAHAPNHRDFIIVIIIIIIIIINIIIINIIFFLPQPLLLII
jgi:hypothetical protein